MSKFDERKVYCKGACDNCKWGYTVEVYDKWEGEQTEERFCMFDASDEDIHYLLEDQPIEIYREHSPKLLEILRISEEDALYRSPRMMESTECCQFFEYEGGKKYEEVQG